MCTLVILRRPHHAWPLLIAANRDEMLDRPWQPPARHWPDRRDIVAGRDELAGGTWLGINDAGVSAAVLNRVGSLGPTTDKRSRGELVLDALDHADAAAAADALADLDGAAYRSFNLVIADNRDAYWLRSTGAAQVEVAPVPAGLSMITSGELNDTDSPRIRNFLHRFRNAPTPDVDAGDWSAWESLLAARLYDADEGPHEAMCIVTDHGYGTVSSSLISLPSPEHAEQGAVWRFAAGPPSDAAFGPVSATNTA
ncbi:MAG: NRDE family protein [Alphaproteobacteria bacterium]|nr:NRDE family protein [Alphaproteobacteria bacterium]